MFQAPQQGREARAATHGNNFKSGNIGGCGKVGHGCAATISRRTSSEVPLLRLAGALRAGIRIKQLCKAWIIRQILEIGIVTRLVTVSRV